MKTRTEQEKERVIKNLLAEKDRLPMYSYFGDNNHLRIDYQIKAVNGEFKNENEIWDLETEELNTEVLGEVVKAFEWLNGSDDDFNDDYNN